LESAVAAETPRMWIEFFFFLNEEEEEESK
jgi:hypothetical protein